MITLFIDVSFDLNQIENVKTWLLNYLRITEYFILICENQSEKNISQQKKEQIIANIIYAIAYFYSVSEKF